jgi:hypothetical protein
MKSTSLHLIVALLYALGFSTCKKDTWPQPHFIMQYNAAGNTYRNEADYNSNSQAYDLTPLSSITTIAVSSDSVLLRFVSSLTAADNLHSITVSVTKQFHRNQLDSSATSYRIKNNDDFYNLFKQGHLNVYTYPATSNDPTIDIVIRDSGEYVFEPPQFTPPVPATLDPENKFEIMNSNTDINFISVDGLPELVPLRLVMVTINFKCRLYNAASPNNERIFTEGVYQGFFRDN